MAATSVPFIQGCDRALFRRPAASYCNPMTETTNALGAYLRARRALVTPQQAGIPDGGVRRVPGLRREEVAMLAGISADYYLRLERGRDRNPSLQVVESLARVLRLDQDHLAHLVALVCEAPSPRRRKARAEVPPPGALNLLNSMTQPAFLEGRYFDVLAANPLASALSPRLSAGRNHLRDLFLDPAEQDLYPDWEEVTECLVASLRQAVGKDIDDPRFIELTGELSLASPRFVKLWAKHDVKGRTGGSLRLNHPQVGELTLNRERLEVGGADGITLVVFHPEQGTDDAGKLALLASAHLPAAGESQRAVSSPPGPHAAGPSRPGSPSSAL